jgi:hypothetical protein
MLVCFLIEGKDNKQYASIHQRDRRLTVRPRLRIMHSFWSLS